MTEIARQTFGAGGVGMAIVQLMLLSIVGWLCGYLARAAGKGQVASMIDAATVFTCIILVVSVAFRAVAAVASQIGL